MEPLVSIIVPCYNVEKYIGRFLDSILIQTYNNNELIIIDDGSTDKTKEIIFCYKDKLENLNMKFYYFYQKNRGLPGAIDTGLKKVSGEYLTWPDPDDILDKDYIREKVKFLEENLQYSIVLSKTKQVNEGNLDRVTKVYKRKRKFENLFEDMILERDIYFMPGSYMVRVKDFLKVNPQRKIYAPPKLVGQNWQMLLPMVYHYQCGYLDKILYTYIVRSDSHSRSVKNQSSLLKRIEVQEDLLETIIKDMRITDEERYLILVKNKYLRQKFYHGYRFGIKKLCNESYESLLIRKALTAKEKIYYFIFQYKYLRKIDLLLANLKPKVKKILYFLRLK